MKNNQQKQCITNDGDRQEIVKGMLEMLARSCMPCDINPFSDNHALWSLKPDKLFSLCSDKTTRQSDLLGIMHNYVRIVELEIFKTECHFPTVKFLCKRKNV